MEVPPVIIKQELLDSSTLTEPNVNYETEYKTQILEVPQIKLESVKLESCSDISKYISMPTNLDQQLNLSEETKMIGIDTNYMLDSLLYKRETKQEDFLDIKLEGTEEMEIENIDYLVNEKWKVKNDELNIKEDENVIDEEHRSSSQLVLEKQHEENATSSNTKKITENSFSCDQCEYKTSNRRNLRLHFKKHKPDENIEKKKICHKMAEKSVTDILEKLCIDLHIKAIKVESDEHFTVVLQCKLVDGEHSEEQCNNWVSKFSDLTYTNWISKRRFANPQRYIFRKVFSCQHADVNKVVQRQREDSRNRNKKCGATIDFKVKKISRGTIRNDKLLKEGRNVVIHINFFHSHQIHVAEAYSYLRMNNSTIEMFNSYFKLGMTPSACKAYYEIKILESDEHNILSSLANAQIKPTQRQVKHLYDKWRKSEYGCREETSVLQILRLKMGEFEKAGVKVVLQEDPLLIVIVTPIMQRTVAEEFSNEIVFIDSSGSCDQSNTYVTFIFTASKIGALPVACILHSAQTESNYALAFSAAKETLEFGKNTFAPQVIMTDDSVAERNALKTVFPTSTLLLCTFHICQAQWRWLWQSNHNISKENRRVIMQLFKDVLYSNTPEEAEENFSVLMSSDEIAKNNLAKEHFTKLWERRLEWCIAHRSNLPTKRNITNNFTEASIRIFKDVILQRCKAFNSCAVVDFIITTFENYYKRRLLEFANSRKTKHQIDFKKFCTKAKDIEKFLKIEDHIYHVVSATDKSLLYTVNTNIAFCDCPQGKSGTFCKHLCSLEQQCGFLFKNSQALFYKDKVKLAKIAVGTDALMDFFKNMESDGSSEEPLNTLEDVSEETAMYHREDTIPVHNLVDDNHSHHKKAVEEFRDEFNRIGNMFEKNCSPEATAILIKLNLLLKNVHTPTQALNFAANAFSRSSKIRVQPISNIHS